MTKHRHLKKRLITTLKATALLFCFTLMHSSKAEERLEMETTIIKGNVELPKILFVVPWKENKQSSNAEQQLRLHNLFEDIFDPIEPTNAVYSQHYLSN